MITVKKDAIKFRNSEGNMQSAGVLCEVGVVGDCVKYANSITFSNLDLFDTEEIVLNLDNATTLYTMFNNAIGNKVKTLVVNCRNKITNAHYCFSAIKSTTLETIILNVDISEAERVDYMFNRLTSLKRILGTPLDLSGINGNTQDVFAQLTNLEDVFFKENTISASLNLAQSSKLSDASIDSMVNGFADMTGQTSPVLTVHKDVKARIEANQVWLATLTYKNVTLA